MTFRKATDDLLAGISHEELAKALGVSVATVRQARLADDAKAHRSPPASWGAPVLRLAKQRADHFKRLVARLEGP
jgi:transposase